MPSSPLLASDPDTGHAMAALPVRPVRFFHRGEWVALEAPAPTRTVLEWLREDRRCTGTKEGCAEGDCGACTVVLGEWDGNAMRLSPVNACIQFLPALDGKALFTVEDVAPAPGELHPVQQALVQAHGSQCGFCTPGFVMSLWASWHRHRQAGDAPSRQELADELSGNLCRCTGYRPILDAAESLFAGTPAPAPAVETARLQAAAQALQAAADGPPLHTGRGWVSPQTVADLAALRLAMPQAQLVAGSTDVGLWVTKQLRVLGPIISTRRVAELQRIDTQRGELVIGAAASLEDAWRALVAQWPSLRDVWLRFASLPIRQAGTLGGNVANGSPIGDGAPVLMALGTELALQCGDRVRRLPLERFYLGYQRNALQPGEFLRALHVPLPAAGQQVQAYKISKRFDSDISALCLGASVHCDDQGRLQKVRLAYGGLAATVCRAAHAEAALLGQPWELPALQAAQQALEQDFTPMSDLRASAAYRLQMARNLLHRLWLQTRPRDPLPESAVSVFARDGTAADPRGTHWLAVAGPQEASSDAAGSRRRSA